MYPHERSLAKRLADKPFALIGINSDRDRASLQRTISDEGITWRSWWDGGGTSGPIATRWQINNWPSLFVLDADGVIRHIDAGGAAVDIAAIEAVVDSLLKELSAPKR